MLRLARPQFRARHQVSTPAAPECRTRFASFTDASASDANGTFPHLPTSESRDLSTDPVLQAWPRQICRARSHGNALISSNSVVDRDNYILAPLDATRWDSMLTVDGDDRAQLFPRPLPVV
jgi:hypothetical protein